MNLIQTAALLDAFCAEHDLADAAADLLTRLIGVDTTMRADLAAMAASESAAFALLEAHFRETLGGRARPERVAIRPAIASEPDYTLPYFSATADHPRGRPAGEVYAGRANLVVRLGEPALPPLAVLNSHVDVVRPWLGARREGDTVFGRGACDAKGPCVSIVLAARMVAAACAALQRPIPPLACQFVIEEETGGNGSLSLATEPAPAPECIVVCEPTGLRVHPANRGAIWYEARLAADERHLAGLAARTILELEAEGRAIFDESDHPLFTSRPVQTCHGVLGPWGSHPSGVCGAVGLFLSFAPGIDAGAAAARLRPEIDAALAQYTARYGDKTREPDPDDASRPKVLRHYDLIPHAGGLWLGLYGKSGHMGSTPLLDGAITKAAYVIARLSGLGGSAGTALGAGRVEIRIADAPEPARQLPARSEEVPLPPAGPAPSCRSALTLAGGQGFVPTHGIADIRRRLADAVARAAREYCREAGLAAASVNAEVTFDRLHNNAYERPPNTRAVWTMLDAAAAAGAYRGDPVEGWNVSCDARLFADHWPDADVLTFGPGSLGHAHSEREQIRLTDILTAARTLALFLLAFSTREDAPR